MLEHDQEQLKELLQGKMTNIFHLGQHFHSHLFKLGTKIEQYGNNQRKKTTVQSAASLNHKDYNEYLIKNIQRLTGIGKR